MKFSAKLKVSASKSATSPSCKTLPAILEQLNIKDMSLIEFQGKPIEKLIETVSKGIGTLYKPRAIRKEADAEAYKIEKIEEANAKAAIIKSDVEAEIVERARQRFIFQEVNRQINLENVVEKSSEYLQETVSEKPVDEDWRTKFFNKAQDVSSEEMQEVWARILASEVSKPGSISLRTLEIVSNLSKEEAIIFQKVASIAFLGGRVLKINSESTFTEFGISFSDLLILKAAGLMHDSNSLTVTFNSIGEGMGGMMRFGEKLISVSKPGQEKFTFQQVSFTPSGEELMNTIKIEPNYSYLEKFIEVETAKGFVFKFIN